MTEHHYDLLTLNSFGLNRMPLIDLCEKVTEGPYDKLPEMKHIGE